MPKQPDTREARETMQEELPFPLPFPLTLPDDERDEEDEFPDDEEPRLTTEGGVEVYF